ncbi:hypothetical protein SAMN04488120_11347 [Fontimonas thermophila]|uniref:Uncharacterized protein n=1 Tax=Fontimonas thermophila TaxID=1076937 RepID=A0A1I2K7H4_9GAMM|nr:hypothetical protein [Fontimonas thermophila]SFF62278.1 hypothetical protein SAMN04488120_11347 [Fontimonas thermophila]
MPRKPKKTQTQTEAPKAFDEFVDEAETVDEEVLSVEEPIASPATTKLRDWRDVEKYKEERELRRLVDDDLDLDDL